MLFQFCSIFVYIALLCSLIVGAAATNQKVMYSAVAGPTAVGTGLSLLAQATRQTRPSIVVHVLGVTQIFCFLIGTVALISFEKGDRSPNLEAATILAGVLSMFATPGASLNIL